MQEWIKLKKQKEIKEEKKNKRIKVRKEAHSLKEKDNVNNVKKEWMNMIVVPLCKCGKNKFLNDKPNEYMQ